MTASSVTRSSALACVTTLRCSSPETRGPNSTPTARYSIAVVRGNREIADPARAMLMNSMARHDEPNEMLLHGVLGLRAPDGA